MGPMRAARSFVLSIEQLTKVCKVHVELFGSLALTGKGHGVEKALVLGLQGHEAPTLDPDTIETRLNKVRDEKTIQLLETHPIDFDIEQHLLFYPMISCQNIRMGCDLLRLTKIKKKFFLKFIIPSAVVLLCVNMNFGLLGISE